MPIKMRQSSLGRLSTVCLAAATVCWVFLLPLRDRRGVLSFFMPEDFEDPQVSSVLSKTQRKWSQVPGKTRVEFIQANLDRLIRRFTSSAVSSMEAATDRTLSTEVYWALVDACSHALGPIVIEMVGSRTRRTAAIQDNDLDLQVRRFSDRKDEPFTDDDMQEVARNLRMLTCVTGPVRVGNVAIKFEMRTRVDDTETQIHVDLVLWRPRREEFPRLRGGDDFYENSARINEFLEQYPAARAAIIGVKQCYAEDRPKGLLLEAIAWRLSNTSQRFSNTSKTCPFQLTKTDRVFAGSEEETWKLQLECFKFFVYVAQELRDWEASPFVSDLKADLALLPKRKQEEHIQRFNKLREENLDFYYPILILDILRTAQGKWTEQDGPWHVYLERQLVEFFPFDRKSRHSQKRKKASTRREPRGFA